MNQYDPDETFISVLDAAGRIQWFDGYQLPSVPGTITGSGRGVVFPTDDGGLFAVQTAVAPGPSSDGSLWALKVFAKNGFSDFNSQATRLPARPFTKADCPPVVSAFAVTSEAITPPIEPMPLVIEAPTTSSRVLAP
jgi:hypothetical protein